MHKRGSVHINRNSKPGFDFLKTVAIPKTPLPQMPKQKKMFLSLYRSIKKSEKIEIPQIEDHSLVEKVQKEY